MISILEQTMQMLPLALCLIIATQLISIPKLKRLGLIGLIGSLTIFVASTPYVGRELMRDLESQYEASSVAQSPVADIIVVLSGAIDLPVPPRREFEITHSGDRLLYAFRLFKADKASQILLTGGSRYHEARELTEAYLSQTLLEEMGVPRSALILESKSVNTYENLVGVKELVGDMTYKRLLLVTSAAHMPRAVAVAEKIGLATMHDVIPAPTDYRVAKSHSSSVLEFIPSAPGLNLTTLALHEYLGWLFYKWKGYL